MEDSTFIGSPILEIRDAKAGLHDPIFGSVF